MGWIARKPIERPDGGLAQPGDPVPFAADWLNPQRWADHGYIEWVEDEPPKKEKTPAAPKVAVAPPAEKPAPRKRAAAKKTAAKSPAKKTASRKPAAAKPAAKTRRSA